MPKTIPPHRLHLLDRILCLEGEWRRDIRREESVEPLLELLKLRGEIEYIHRRCGTRGEFIHYLAQQKGYRDYRIVYLAFHGAEGKLRMSPGEEITLVEMADLVPGAFEGRIVYFGSCATLARPVRELRAFLHKTGAEAVAGYTREVDWVESSAFELMFLYWAAYYKKPAYLLRKLAARYERFQKLIGFKYYAARPGANVQR